MFREKLTKNPNKRGYLYIRESVYDRDRRTLKRKPSKLYDGTAKKQRGKYSKKKDIYCGKIYEPQITKIETFEHYIENIYPKNKQILKKNNKKTDYLQFKTTSTFDQLLDSFIEYLLYIYNIKKKDYNSKPKKVYAVGEGYISKDIIKWLKKFNINGNPDNSKEIQRFTYRCQDCGIYDEETINSLYLKLVPDIYREEIQKEIENLKQITQNKQNFKGLKDFLKKN